MWPFGNPDPYRDMAYALIAAAVLIWSSIIWKLF